MKGNSITVVICDDEVRILKEMKAYVERIFRQSAYQGEVIAISDSAKLAERLETAQIDILLLDIDMPHINGMELAGAILEKRLPILLIFVTGKESLVYDSFQYQPFSFIRKSMYEKELEDTLLRAIRKLLSRDTIALRQGGVYMRLDLSDILYLEADGNYVKIVTEKETVRHRETLSHMEQQLDGKGFIRIHKGFLVNEQAVFRLLSDKVALTNGEELPIGRKSREETRKLLLRGFRI